MTTDGRFWTSFAIILCKSYFMSIDVTAYFSLIECLVVEEKDKS